MSVAVVVPWRSGGCPHREAAWQYVRAGWASELWPLLRVVAADDGGEPFSRAASITGVVEQLEADVYVVADADTFAPMAQIHKAVIRAREAPGLVVAFERFCALGMAGTQYVLAGEEPRDEWCEWSWPGVSSCVAFSAETWQRTGGFDPRFRGWGMEDVAFEIACRTLAGPTRRVAGNAWHLWHPQERNRPAENVALLRQYEAADGNPDAVRALRAAEEKSCESVSTSRSTQAIRSISATSIPQPRSIPRR